MGSKPFWQTVLKAGKQVDLLHYLLCYYATRSPTDPELYIIGVDAFAVLAACAAKADHVFVSAEKIFFYKLCRMLAYPAKFVWIWEGKHKPSEKNGRAVKTETLWGNVQFLIKAFGGVVQKAPGEAEAELARMNAAGLIHAVMTHDSDAAVFGAVTIIQWNSTTSPQATIYHSSEISRQSGLSANGLVLFWIFCGNDYNRTGLPGCGPQLAIRIIKTTQFADRLVDTFHVHFGEALRSAIGEWANDLCQWLRKHGLLSIADSWPLGFPSTSLLTNIISPTVSDLTSSFVDTFERYLRYPPALPTLVLAYRRVFGVAREGGGPEAVDVAKGEGDEEEDNNIRDFEAEMLKTFRNNVYEPYITHCLCLPNTIHIPPNVVNTSLGRYTLSKQQQRITKKLEDTNNSDLVFTRHQVYFDIEGFIRESLFSKQIKPSTERVSAWVPFVFAQRIGLGDRYIRSDLDRFAGQPTNPLAGPCSEPTGRILSVLCANDSTSLVAPPHSSLITGERRGFRLQADTITSSSRLSTTSVSSKKRARDSSSSRPGEGSYPTHKSSKRVAREGSNVGRSQDRRKTGVAEKGTARRSSPGTERNPIVID